ncbi:membrane protein of unknown function (plasmid) [Shinella sp. WSC3-e]|nr:membrane hypothetical protein [Rhizobiaceae bacterium]CAK7261139.1 membrane protein of unknown function [Shinella sp. WSC3-e]
MLIHAAVEFVISSPTWLSIGDNPIKPFMGKLVLEVFFVLLAILFAYMLSRMRGKSYSVQLFVCLLLSLCSSLGMSMLDYCLYSSIMLPAIILRDLTEYGYAVCCRMLIFFGWSFLFIALLALPDKPAFSLQHAEFDGIAEGISEY